MSRYSTEEVAKLLGLSPAQVRAWVRAGFLSPDDAGAFDFQDLVLLRTAKGLVDADIAPRRVKRALDKLRAQLPEGRPLSAVSIGAEGNRIVVRDGAQRWNPESGQALFDFEVRELAEKVSPLVRKAAAEARADADQGGDGKKAEEWHGLGVALEICDPREARDAYRRAIELDPWHVDAHLNLGRLLHEAGEYDAAEAHYRVVIEAQPESATARFNLGVLFADQAREDEAVAAYEAAIALDARFADAHWNLAHLFERMGRQMHALRHLKAYKKLTEHRR